MKFRFVSVVILSVFYYLALTLSLYAAMPLAEKEEESQQDTSVSVSGEPSGRLHDRGLAAMKKKVMEEIKKTEEEKRRIIESVKKEEGREDKKRPFIIKGVSEKVASPMPMPVEPKKADYRESHNVLLGEKPLQVFLALLILSLITYLIYRFVLQRIK